jgi:hypothetical protein
VQTFLRHPEAWAQILGAAIPQTSNFFLNYVVTRAFMMNFVRLLMPRKALARSSVFLLLSCVGRTCEEGAGTLGEQPAPNMRHVNMQGMGSRR